MQFDIKKIRLSLKNPWTISRNSSSYKDNVFVKLEKDGITGYGEAAPNIRYGENPDLTMSKIEDAVSSLEAVDFLHYTDVDRLLNQSISGQSCAKAALDIALMDWIGKSAGLPLYQLFGLNPDRIPGTSFSIGIDTKENVIRKVKNALDFPVLKIKVGYDGDEEMVTWVRSITDKPIRVDANEGWKSKETALEKILWLQSQGVELIEQPLPYQMINETAWLRERISIPVIADEAVKKASDIAGLIGAYDGINIKLMKSGGIQEALRMIHVAKTLNLKIMVGCMIESSVAISAAAHIAAHADWVDLDGNLLIKNDPFTGIGIEKGKLMLSENPGLGVRPTL
ncbi:MAG: dipeptide epimerase [Calditrichaceae bacterium]